MSDYSLLHALLKGWFVVTLLLGGSVVSITVFLERLVALRRARLDAREFALTLLKIIEREGFARAIAFCENHRQPLAEVVRAVLLAPGGRDEKERAYQHVLRAQMRSLQSYLPILGTIASVAPYVGLLGTVMGVFNAFRDIAKNVGGGPEVVAGGISEALITTAGGLMVAIPAVIFYNVLVTRVRRLAEEIDLVAHEINDRLAEMKDVLP